MDSNYQWQQHQARERSQSRRRDAEIYRALQEARPQRESLLIRTWRKLFAKPVPDNREGQRRRHLERPAGIEP
jgi:hypothetical protein